MDLEKVIVKNIKTYRTLKGYSQEYIAIQLDITQSAYAKIENGKNEMTISKFLKIAEILDVDVLQILLSEKIDFKLDNIVDKIRTLDKTNRELMVNLLETKQKLIEALAEKR